MHDRNLRSTDRAATECFAARFRAFVLSDSFPCVGARSALNKSRMEFGVYDKLEAQGAAEALCADLEWFSARYKISGTDPVSFVAMFKEPTADEATFETQLWDHIQVMHDVDRRNYDWDPSVSSDPTSAEFSLSIAGRAFFVVGLSPTASRMSRRAPFPCLVFNFHDQFEALKEGGKYASMQKAIRKRDIALQGSINPVLARFGEASEARQYAGSAVADDWACPFKQGAAAHAI